MSDTRKLDEGYVIIGHPVIPSQISFFLSGDGLKKLVSQLREGEDLRMTVGEYRDEQGNEHSYHRFEAVDTHHRYSKVEAT